jgi:ATP-dependent DNA ligase
VVDYRAPARNWRTLSRLYRRRGYDWTQKNPLTGEAMRKLRVTSVTIDGEGIYCGPDGLADFEKLHSQAFNDRIFAFDLLELDGVDCRPEPLEKRSFGMQGW